MEELIVTKAKELFFSYGIKSVSMDDISRKGAISKKTIYKCFEDKNQLIERLVSELLSRFKSDLEKSSKQGQNAIEELTLASQTTINSISAISPAFFYDLKKFFPGLWQLVEQHSHTVLMPSIANNLKKGINEGLYREDLDIAFTTNIRIQQITSVVGVDRVISRVSESHELMLKLTRFYLHAIATARGKQLINNYLNGNNDKEFSN